MQPFFAAISFLTIIRVPTAWCGDERAFASSMSWYPLVGLLIGLIMAVFDKLFCWLLPGFLVPSALMVIAMIAVSGGLHLDGVADSADAFMSSRGKERMLEIMKDSCTGPMGALAIVSLLLVKFAMLASLAAEWRTPVIVLMPLAGRVALVLKVVSLPYVRNQGLASLTHEHAHKGQGGVAVAFLLFASCLLLGMAGLWVVLVSLVFTGLFAVYCMKKIGGFTGDTLGAACELAELAPALTVLICMQQGLLV